MEIKLEKRIKYAGDIHTELLNCGFTPAGAAELLEHVPDAKDVAPVVHARWNPYHESDFCWDEYGVICTNCNFKVENKDFTFPGKYCPNCGAKMDGGVSESQ